MKNYARLTTTQRARHKLTRDPFTARRNHRLDVMTTEAAVSMLHEIVNSTSMRKCEAVEWAIARAYLQGVQAGTFREVA